MECCDYYSSGCRDCTQPCYGNECLKYCCNLPMPNVSCRDCAMPCFGYECDKRCCEDSYETADPPLNDNSYGFSSSKDEPESNNVPTPPRSDNPNEGGTSSCHTCSNNSPCTRENIDDGEFYHSHCDANKFVQCDEFGGCHEMPCGAGLIWDQDAMTCNWP
eukprot:2967223-Ditylum_brightwellii.AAC.1